MKYEDAKSKCHVRSAIYRTGDPTKIFTMTDLEKIHPALQELNKEKIGNLVPKRYYKNYPVSLDDRISEEDKIKEDWEEYDPRDEDNSSLFMYND